MPHRREERSEQTLDEFDDTGKTPQRHVNLRPAKSGEPEQCSVCENWLGHRRTRGGSLSTGACALVEGQVRTYEICDLYEKGPLFQERYYGNRSDRLWCEECQALMPFGHSH